jgi:hypothetical protein
MFRLMVVPPALSERTASIPFFSEGFEDTRLTSRGWYDGNRFVLSDDTAAGRHFIRSGSRNKEESMINTILDACRYVLEDQGEAQSSYWLSSIMMEMKLWRASESQVRDALDRDIEQFGESSPFEKVGENLYALRSWKTR